MDFLTVGEAKYLYQYHAEACFVLCMKSRRTREEDQQEKYHNEESERYLKLLKASGVEVPDMNTLEAKLPFMYKRSSYADLYAERQSTGDKP